MTTKKPPKNEVKDASTTEPKPKGRRQLEIAGTERPKIREVDTAAASYVEVRDQRMKLTEEEKEAKDTLIAVMAKHKLEFYEDLEAVPPVEVRIIPGDVKVKVKKINGETEI